MNNKVAQKTFVLVLLLVIGLLLTNRLGAAPAIPQQGNELQSATIVVSYGGSWSPAAQAAMEYAADIWESAVYSPVPIAIRATWGSDFLGGPAYVFATYSYGFPQAPNPIAIYPTALYNALTGSDPTTDADFTIQFNSDFNNWYYDTDGNAPAGNYDFVTVALKSIGWGLGLDSDMKLCGPPGGCWGSEVNRVNPYVYDTLAVNGAGHSLTDTGLFPNPSPALQEQLTSNNVYFAGLEAVAANGGTRPKLYAPASWGGIKYPLLLDDAAFPKGSINALMTHTLETGEVIHDPGPLAKAMLYDLGWPKPLQAPVLQPLPGQVVLVNTSHDNAIDLWQYVSDSDTPVGQLTFTIANTPAAEAGVGLDNNRYIDINPTTDWTGETTVVIEVEDPDGLTASQSFKVLVVTETHNLFLPLALKP